MKTRSGATMAAPTAVRRPARYQTMKFRRVIGRLSPSASERGVTSLEMALRTPYRYSTTGENLPQPTSRPGVRRPSSAGRRDGRRGVGLAHLHEVPVDGATPAGDASGVGSRTLRNTVLI